ncbi:DUF302 domain-containing protein [Elioraea sp.]|uniref:DUF302 domain-containing protein n=1 Tax=Elioraea sp. TaxID=2185103 RepID=UPI003F700A4F
MVHRIATVVMLVVALSAPAASAPESGLVTRPSTHSAEETARRFVAAVQSAGWKVFAEISHDDAARSVGMTLRPRRVILFGNPAAGTPAMQRAATLALDLPMRVLVWEDDAGRAFLTRSTGKDIGERVFARHGLPYPAEVQQGFDRFVTGLVRAATE